MVLCTVFVSFTAFADDILTGSCGQNITWTYDKSAKTLILTGTGNMPNYDISSKGSITPWRKFSEENYVKDVTICDGITSIGDNAFFECDRLTDVTIAKSVTAIGDNAFYKCESLADITIPSGVTNISSGAFENCTGLTNVTIPVGVTSIGDSAFGSCRSLKSIVIPDGVTNIGIYAFQYCSELTNISLPNSITHIGDCAFNGTNLYNEWWYNSKQNNVLYIGNHLIKADEQVINDGIKDGTVSEKYDIAPGTKTIADYAFNGCGNLKEITIPDSVVSIGSFSFNSCYGLQNITIPKSVTSVGNCAFQTCMDLENISVADGNTAYFDDDGVLYNKEKTEIVCFSKNKRNISFEIPNGITKIADGAFEYCDNLTNIIIPNSVKSIGNNAFDRCALLTGITIPNSVQSIGSSAFLECSNLTDIAIPDGVQSIGEKTFFECVKLKSITIPNSVTSIGENAFKTCTQLNEINYDGNPSDWENVQGNGKGFFAYKTITYCKGIKVEKLDNGNIVTEPTNTDTGKTVILALYSGGKDNNGGSLVEIQQKKYSGTEITFETNKVFTYAKVMVWENFDSISPVCAVKIVK